MTHARGVVAFLLAALLLFAPAGASDPPPPSAEFWDIPASALAICAVDPEPFGEGDPARALIEAGLRGLIDNAIPLDAPGPLDLAGLLAPGVLRQAPYRFCLLSLEGGPPREAARERVATINKLAAVLEIRPPADNQAALSAAVRAAIDRAAGPRSGAGTEASFTLRSGVRATRFTREGEPAWRTIEWASNGPLFLIGFGAGSLDLWQTAAAPAPKGAASEPAAHLAQIARQRPRTGPAVQAYFDLNALRLAATDEFVDGRLGKLLRAWHLANARGLMIHARLPRAGPRRPDEPPEPPQTGPPLLALDLTYSSRAEPPGTVRHVALSATQWPADTGPLARPTAGSYAVLLRANWPQWTLLGIDTYAALAPAAAAGRPERWLRRAGPALERLTAQAKGWVLITGGPPAQPPRPIFAAAIEPAAANAKARLDADLRAVFGSLGEEVRRDNATGVWSLRLDAKDADPDGLLKLFCWTLSPDGTHILGAWDPAALSAPRKPGR